MENVAVLILRAERDRKASDLEAANIAVRDLKAAIKSIDEAIATISGAPIPEANHKPRSSGESLKIVISRIVTDEPGLSPSDISDRLLAIGRGTDMNTILGTLSRAKKEGLIHKDGRVWFGGPENANTYDNPETKDPAEAGSQSNAGHVAELEVSPDAQHPIRNRENVGSSPTVSAPFHRSMSDLPASTNAPAAPTNPRVPPWMSGVRR